MARSQSKTLLLGLCTALVPALALAPLVLAQARLEIGAIVTARGEVNVRDGSGTVRAAAGRERLYEGDAVLVAAGGFASLRMVDNAHLTLGPDTEFAFERYRFDGKPATRDSVVLHLVRGCFRTTSGVAGSASRDEYRVATPVANIEVDATYHGATLIGDRLYTATWDGATVVGNTLGSISLGNYGDFEYSRTLPGEAPKGLRALLPEATCAPPQTLDEEAESERVTVKDRDRAHEDEGKGD